MPRTLIPGQTPRPGGVSPANVKVADQPSDPANGNYLPFASGLIVLARVLIGGAGGNVTIKGYADKLGRVQDEVFAIAQAEYFMIGPLPQEGYVGPETAPGDGDGGIHINTSDASIRLAVILP